MCPNSTHFQKLSLGDIYMGLFNKIFSLNKTESSNLSQLSTVTPTTTEIPKVSRKEFLRISHNIIDSTNKALVLALNDYVVLDLETTGLNAFGDKIVEIAIVTVKDGEIIDEFSSLVNPECSIPTAATDIHGIISEDVIDAPKYVDIAPIVYKIINNHPIIAHNAAFDISFIKELFRSQDIYIELSSLDTLSLSKHVIKDCKNHKLETLATYYGINLGNSHRALDDARTTMQLFERLKTQMYDKKASDAEVKQIKKERLKAERMEKYGKSPVFDLNFVFTGEFVINRELLQSLIENVGGNLRNEVNTKTRYLVVGETKNLPDWAIERKLGKAKELISNGKNIELISEANYLLLIQQAVEIMSK